MAAFLTNALQKIYGHKCPQYPQLLRGAEIIKKISQNKYWQGFLPEAYISIHVGISIPTRIFFLHAEIFKSGYFMQIYSNQSVLCRNIGQVPLRVTQSCAADYLDRTKPNQTPPECPAAVKRQVTL